MNQATQLISISEITETVPEYIGEVKKIVSVKKVCPLKDLFMQIRKQYPEVESMRNLKEDIETYIDDFSVNNNNLVISKNSLFNDIIKIISK